MDDNDQINNIIYTLTYVVPLSREFFIVTSIYKTVSR